MTHWSSRRHDASATARTGQRRHQRAEVEVAAQVDPHDARQRLPRCAAARRGSAQRSASARPGMGFAPRVRVPAWSWARAGAHRHRQADRHSAPGQCCCPRRCAPAPARLRCPWAVPPRCRAGSARPCRRPAIAAAWARSARWRAGIPAPPALCTRRRSPTPAGTPTRDVSVDEHDAPWPTFNGTASGMRSQRRISTAWGTGPGGHGQQPQQREYRMLHGRGFSLRRLRRQATRHRARRPGR